ncbi:ATP-binding protein [Methylobacterium sp. WSM2598]|uniref:ATP-binding protein n=1 Tax=Methylobacterium sp. WSM2598 TaxID=398261 RepID=UPI00036DAC0A|nr:ATP-binding protein [Methylobacterium sp. WSM2598]
MSPDEKVAAAAKRLEQTANENGGPYQEPEAYRGSIARTMFDRSGAEDGTVTALVPEDRIGDIAREAYVRIPSIHPRTNKVEAEYLGVVASRPFAEPDALSATAPTLVVAAAHRAVLTPKYHGIAQIQVFGERVDGQIVPPVRRPCPNSPVFLLGDEEVKAVLGLNIPPDDKPVRLGLLDGASSIAVAVPAAQKSVLFKHLAILGTTGGGKSTTVSGTIMNLAEAGNAVVVFDIEGEYTTMNDPSSNPRMLAALKKRGLDPRGADKTKLFYLSGRTPASPDHPSQRDFKIAFDDLSPYVLAEVLDLSEPQERRLLDAYEVCRITMERTKIYPANDDEQREALEIDELLGGWPRMTVEMMLDVVGAAIEQIDGNADDFRGRRNGFAGHEKVLLQTLNARKIEKDSRSWKAIAKRLWRMKKAGVFADRDRERIDVGEMLVPGQISIVDLSDMDAPYLRNLVIAQMLRALQTRQDELYGAREDAIRFGQMPKDLTKVNIFIEEAHEFLSAQRIKQMPNLFDQVARIARRGRKRYLGLVFVTQLPSHLPDEVLGLVNNWILHKLTDSGVVNRLRKVVPGVNEATWNSLPNLAPGQALCSFTHLARPVMTTVDPSPCQLRMVD